MLCIKLVYLYISDVNMHEYTYKSFYLCIKSPAGELESQRAGELESGSWRAGGLESQGAGEPGSWKARVRHM